MIQNGQPIDDSQFVFSAVTGQALAADDAVMIGNGVDTGGTLLRIDATQNANRSVAGTTWVAQRVRFPAVRNITAIGFKHDTNAGYTVRIRASLTGPDLAIGTVGAGGNSAIVFRVVTLSTPVDLDPDTDYYVIFNGSHAVHGQSTSIYADGEAHVSTNGGSSWAEDTTVRDYHVLLIGGITESGKLYKAVESLPGLFCGFVDQAYTLGATARVSPQYVVDWLSSLTPGSEYFLSPTPGVIAPTGTHKIGLAVNATTLIRDFARS